MGDPFTALTKRPPRQASHDPKVARRRKTARVERDAAEAEYLEYLYQLRVSIWGRP